MLLAFLNVQAQQRPASLRGFVFTKSSGEAIPFANVVLFNYENEGLKNGATSDFDGKYEIKPVKPGFYRLECTFVGYAKLIVDSIQLSPSIITTQNLYLSEESAQLEEVVISYEAPLIDATKSSKVITSEEIKSMAVRDISSVSSQAAGVTQDAYGNTNIRGARSEGTVYFIDGVKVRGSVNFEHQNGEVLGREEYASVSENAFLKTEVNPLSTFSSDVDVASYANVRRYLQDGYLPPADAVRIEEMLNYFSYRPLPVETGKTFAVNQALVECPWEKEHQLLRISINTEKLAKEKLAPNNLVFLIDVSGSMNNHNKLPLLKKSLRLLVNNLREEDYVSLVVYASSTGVVLEPTSGDNKTTINEAINRLSSGGSTAGGAGIELAYSLAEENFKKGHNNRIILATDGDFNLGPSSESALKKLIEEKRESGVFLSVLGFGTGNYMDAKMEALADNGNGNYAYIDNIMEAKKVLVEEMGATLNVVAKDTKLQVEFNPKAVGAYRLIGYENRMLAAEDFNDDAKDAGDIGSGHYVTALYEIVPKGKEAALGKDVDDLKYQNKESTTAFADELATVKIRHKKPADSHSILEEHIVKNEIQAISPDLSFMASVAGFGMLLRNSPNKGLSDYPLVLSLAQAGLKAENVDYRSEYVRLVELAKELQKGGS